MRTVLSLLFAALFFAQTASAAPIWLERRAVPKAEIIDARFALRDDASTIIVDHSLWDEFLKTYVVAGEDEINRVRYRAIDAEAIEGLSRYIASLEAIDPAALSPSEQLAFWINLYNAATIRLIAENPGIDSIRDIKKPWGQTVVTVAAVPLTLGDIEHGVLRPVFKDPRVHYAVNCASIGCPNLALDAYAGALINEELERAARAYVNHPRGVAVEEGRVAVSKIYGWYQKDFGADDAEILAHIRKYADPDLLLSLEGVSEIGDYRYDWSLNKSE